MQRGDDFFVAEAAGHELQDFKFAWCEVFLRVAVGEFFLQSLAEIWLAGGDSSDGLDDFRNFCGFAHISNGSSLGGPKNTFRVFENGNQDDAGLGEFGANFSDDLVAIPIRQFEIHRNNIGEEFAIERHGIFSVFRLADEGQVGVPLNGLGYGKADHGMVINDQNADGWFHESFRSRMPASGDV